MFFKSMRIATFRRYIQQFVSQIYLLTQQDEPRHFKIYRGELLSRDSYLWNLVTRDNKQPYSTGFEPVSCSRTPPCCFDTLTLTGDFFLLVGFEGFETADRLSTGNSQSPQNSQSSDSSSDEYHLDELEDILNYKFKDKSLLKEAITHASINNAKSYERLEFLGDSILGFLISKHICCTYPDYDRYKLTILRSQNVDTEKLARVCVKHEFHKYLLHKSPGFEENIEEFVKDIADNSKSFRCGDLKPIKVLADIVESLAGAVFLDNGYSADKVWEVFRPLLEPLVTPETLKLHPVTELQELCQKKGKYLHYEHSWIGNVVTAQVRIDGEVVGIGENQRKDLAVAQRVAAKNALDELKKEEDKIQTSSKDDKQSRSHEQVLIARQDLNNFCAKKHWISPDYKFESEEGPPHMKKFVYSVSVEKKNGWTDNFVGNPMPTKNMAKDSAAKALLDFLGKNNYD